MFSTEGAWKEQRYDVSDTRGVFGMGTVLTSCYSESPEAILELRLARNFKKIKFDVGQANDSGTSDNNVIVDVIMGQNKIDSKALPFDTVQAFDEDIPDANSLKLAFRLDRTKCKNGGVTVVVSDLTVS